MLVVGTVSGVVRLRQILDIHALGLEFRLEQRQLFFGNLFAAATAPGGQQLPQQVLGLDPARFGGVQLRDQVEHHPLQNIRALGQLFAVDGH